MTHIRQKSFRNPGKYLSRINLYSGKRLRSPPVKDKLPLDLETEKRVEDRDEVVELEHQLRRSRVLGQALAALDESPGHGKHKRFRKGGLRLIKINSFRVFNNADLSQEFSVQRSLNK